MHRPDNLDLAKRSELDPADLLSDELRYAVTHARRPGQVLRVQVDGEDKSPENVEVLYFPQGGRAGISWQGITWWLDAASPEDAVERWVRGDGRSNMERHRVTEAVLGRDTLIPALDRGETVPLSIPIPPMP